MKIALLRTASERFIGVRTWGGLRNPANPKPGCAGIFCVHGRGAVFWWRFSDREDGQGGLVVKNRRNTIKRMALTLIRNQEKASQ